MYPKFNRVEAHKEDEDAYRLDVAVAASGFSKQDADKLEQVRIIHLDIAALIHSVQYKNEVDQLKDTASDDEEEDEDGDVTNPVNLSEGNEDSDVEEKFHSPDDSESEDNIDDTDRTEDEEVSEAANEMDQNRRALRSRCPSPTDSLIEHTAALGLSDKGNALNSMARDPDVMVEDVTSVVTKELSKQRAKQGKFHSKAGSRRIGRPKGSKAKQEFRFKGDGDSWGS